MTHEMSRKDWDYLQNKWFALAYRTKMQDEEFIWKTVQTLYNDKRRTYHNLNHILFLYKQLEKSNNYISDNILELTIWFHDLYYTGNNGIDEELSANLFNNIIFKNLHIGLGGPHSRPYSRPSDKRIVNDAIRATANHTKVLATSRTTTLYASKINAFLDLDMSILASSEEDYNTYYQSVLKEYQNLFPKIDPNLIKAGRMAWISKTLESEKIFHVSPALEAPARENLARELKEHQKV